MVKILKDDDNGTTGEAEVFGMQPLDEAEGPENMSEEWWNIDTSVMTSKELTKFKNEYVLAEIPGFSNAKTIKAKRKVIAEYLAAITQSVAETVDEELAVVVHTSGPNPDVKIGEVTVEGKLPVSLISEGEVAGPDPLINVQANIAKLDKDTALPALHSTINAAAENDFYLGGVLALIQLKGWWPAEYDTFKDFVDAEMPFQYRKATYLTHIYNTLVSEGIPYQIVKDLGWTKVRMLIGHSVMTSENWEKWVELGKQNSIQKLEGIIKSAKETGADVKDTDKIEPVEVSTLAFKAAGETKVTILEALEKAKEESGSSGYTHALELICQEFLATPGMETKGTPTKKQLRGMFESIKNDLSEDSLDYVFGEFQEVWPEYNVTITHVDLEGK